jgi:hypothetical protein
MNLIKRLAATAPEKLVEEVSRLRADRDNLRDALSLKIVDFVRTISIGKEDVLIVRRPERLNPDTMLETVEKVAAILNARYQWNGTIIVGSECEGLDKLTEDETKNLYYLLKARFEKEGEQKVQEGSGGTDAKP